MSKFGTGVTCRDTDNCFKKIILHLALKACDSQWRVLFSNNIMTGISKALWPTSVWGAKSILSHLNTFIILSPLRQLPQEQTWRPGRQHPIDSQWHWNHRKMQLFHCTQSMVPNLHNGCWWILFASHTGHCRRLSLSKQAQFGKDSTDSDIEQPTSIVDIANMRKWSKNRLAELVLKTPNS